MTLRKLSKIASIGMAVLGLVVVPPLRKRHQTLRSRRCDGNSRMKSLDYLRR